MAPHAAVHLPPAPSSDVVHRFLAGTLDSTAWTHGAHLLVCHHVLATSEAPAVALGRLRTLIQEHNARVGLRPGHGGYHETITQYYVGAMAHLGPATGAEVLAAPALQREAPLERWTTEALRSDAARTGWIDPDLAPLPWTPILAPSR